LFLLGLRASLRLCRLVDRLVFPSPAPPVSDLLSAPGFSRCSESRAADFNCLLRSPAGTRAGAWSQFERVSRAPQSSAVLSLCPVQAAGTGDSENETFIRVPKIFNSNV
jgi:hypothetical protein